MPKFNNGQELEYHINTTGQYPNFAELGKLLKDFLKYADIADGVEPELDEQDGMPGGTRSYLTQVADAFSDLGEDKITNDETYLNEDKDGDVYIKSYLNPLAEKLRYEDIQDNTPYKYLMSGANRLEKVKPGAKKKLYNLLHEADEYFGLDLHMEELDPDYAKAVKAGSAKKKTVKTDGSVKQQAPGQQALELSWDNYDKFHKPGENAHLDFTRKKDWLSKRMVASAAIIQGEKEGNAAIPFTKSTARAQAEKIRNTWAFKHLSKDEEAVGNLLTEQRTGLATMWNNITRPFSSMTLDARKAKIEELYEMATEHMMSPAGRSSKYRNMYNSITQAYQNRNNLVDNDNPAVNGEKDLQNIFDQTEKYMKGKKSMRSKDDEKCRFDQSVDVIACLGRGSDGAKLMSEGLIDRINTVRSGKGQPTVNSAYYGTRERAKEHSNAQRLEQLQEEAAKKKKAPKKAEAGKTAKKPEYTGPVLSDLSKINAEKPGYSKETVPEYTGTAGLTANPAELLPAQNFWAMSSGKNGLNAVQMKLMLAGALAMKTAPLYIQNGVVGVDREKFQETYVKYVDDPAVREMAEKLRDYDARKKYFREGEKESLENLDFDKLKLEYDVTKKGLEISAGPSM